MQSLWRFEPTAGSGTRPVNRTCCIRSGSCFGVKELERIVAVLHDVVEDTATTMSDLRRIGFSEAVLFVLDCVTKRPGEDYAQFIERAAANPAARKVKLADLEDNLDVRRLSVVTEKDAARLEKYVRAWRRLKDDE